MYISPDRTLEERKERKLVVDRLKGMANRYPDKHFIIRGNLVVEGT